MVRTVDAMGYCNVCGSELSGRERFCTCCGSPTSQEKNSGISHEGSLAKCPNCGEVLSSFVLYCPACGLELRGKKAAQSVADLATKIEHLELKRPQKKRGFFARAQEASSVGSVEQAEITLIRSFPIPNAAEDLIEFMILATSNIDEDCYSSFYMGGDKESRKAVSGAWLSKARQVLEKVRLSDCSEAQVSYLAGLLEDAKRRIKDSKRKGILKWCLLYSPIILLFLILLVVNLVNPLTTAKENERLTDIVELIEPSLNDGDYLRALRYAESLEFHGAINDSSAEHMWDIEREQWIERVLSEAQSNGVDLSDKLASLEDENTEDKETDSESEIQKSFDQIQSNLDEFNRILSGGE